MVENDYYNTFEIKIPFTTIAGGQETLSLPVYHEFLLTKVYPAIDKLYSEGLIDTYHFLMHENLDLRISIPDETKIDTIKNILAEFELPIKMQEWGRGRPKIEDDILRYDTEKTRLLIQHPVLDKFLSSAIHNPINQLGINNLVESEIHINEAINWRFTYYVETEKMSREDAKIRVTDELSDMLSKYLDKIEIE